MVAIRFEKILEIRPGFAPGTVIKPRHRFCYVISVTNGVETTRGKKNRKRVCS
jgi:hypothetical protein